MQAKPSVQEAEKESIVKDVQDAYLKGLKPPDDDRRLRFVVSIDKRRLLHFALMVSINFNTTCAWHVHKSPCIQPCFNFAFMDSNLSTNYGLYVLENNDYHIPSINLLVKVSRCEI